MSEQSTLIVVNRHGMGSADEVLQLKVFTTWLRITQENGVLPGAMAFYTDGVRLVCDDSPVLELLQAFEKEGVHVISCKTCLDAFGLADRVAVGVVGGMGDIVAAQRTAEKVINL